jgi:solute carrier family 25 protein 38
MEYGGPQRVSYKNTFDALATIARSEGPRGLYRGLGPTVLTNAPFSALYYMFYTRLKSALASDEHPQAAVNFVSGVVAATAATLLTQPADVVRTRMQLSLAGTTGADAWSTFGKVLKAAGPSALLTGAPLSSCCGRAGSAEYACCLGMWQQQGAVMSPCLRFSPCLRAAAA